MIVPNFSLALQGGIASGTEQTFDGQPMQAGTHLRWSFLSALGFPPGGFQLWRRIATADDVRITPPRLPQPPTDTTFLPSLADTGAPASDAPGWSAPDTTDNGWQSWGSLFTLPVTNANWPARYYNAPAPTAANVVAADIAEAGRRLGTLKLAANDTPAQQQSNLQDLRSELIRLVNGYPNTSLANVPLQAPSSGANAPSLSINVMDQLLLLALDPYFARVLGLYFVDTQTAPGVQYDYAIAGYWGRNQAVPDIIYPGLAPGAQLAKGACTYQGLQIRAADGTSIWRWIEAAGANKQLDPTCPQQALAVVDTALSTLNITAQPAGIMILSSSGVVAKGNGGAPGVDIAVVQGTPAVDIQVAGQGTITAYTQSIGQSQTTAMAAVSFNAPEFTTISVAAPGYYAPIVGFTISGVAPPAPGLQFTLVGSITVYATAPGAIGNIYALLTKPAAITAPPAPGQPITTFRKRQAVIDTSALKLAPQSLFDVEWPAPTIDPSSQTGDPYTDPSALPPPVDPIGFLVTRKDNTPSAPVTRIPNWVASRSVPKEKGSKITTANLFRLSDSQLPDPATNSAGYSHSVSAFNIFGVAGAASPYSTPVGVLKIAAAPTALRILQFDNSAAGGGAALPDGSAWVGGKLNLQVAWDASAFILYPDIQTAQAQLISIDNSGNSTGTLTEYSFDVPAPVIKKLTATVTVTPNGDGYVAAVQTTPPLPPLADIDPGSILMLTAAAPDPTSLNFVINASVMASNGMANLNVSKISRLVTSTSSFQNQPAYLVSGWSPASSFLIPVPLNVPVAQQTARGQVSIVGSTKNPFLLNEQIVDPNEVVPNRPEPQSVPLTFTGAQRLVPAIPQTPLPDVNHVYYDPADATGQSGKDLPFTTPAGSGIYGYVLKRAPIHSLAIADMGRRNSLSNAFDSNPTLSANGQNLAAWIGDLPQWLTAYNAINHTSATAANVLESGAGQRSFIDHFYGGLLDEELRALGDLAANSSAFARVNPSPIQPTATPPPIHDTVDGTGYARNLYKLAAVNQAGSVSGDTGSVGPYYTRIVSPPRPPVLYKVQSASAAIVVAWALDTNPDVAAYMIYRSADFSALADLRFFGQDPTHPAALSALPSVTANTQSYPPLSFVQGSGGNVDPRLIGFVPDPRLVARDYTNSVMAEILLPPGPPPDQINAVYRLSDFITAAGKPQLGFNYWTTPVSGLPAVVQSSPTQTRLTGLRIGLGRGMPVVVVATWAGVQKALGVVPVRRAGFVDVASSPSTPSDPNAIAAAPAPSASAPNFYAVASVDIFGNRSAPSKIFAGQMFGTR
jgi:hypothetical protein